jgi:acyl carrier protein
MNNEILKEIEIVLKKVFHSDEISITESTTAYNIPGWDSLTHMTVISELEDHFNVQFTFDEVSDFNCIGDIIKIINLKIKDAS